MHFVTPCIIETVLKGKSRKKCMNEESERPEAEDKKPLAQFSSLKPAIN
jgi:hypothetical protein